MTAVFLYGILGLIHQNIFAGVWLILTFLITALLLFTLGLALQVLVLKYPSLLIRVKEDRYDIILFAFTFGQTSCTYQPSIPSMLNPSRLESEKQKSIRRVPIVHLALAE